MNFFDFLFSEINLKNKATDKETQLSNKSHANFTKNINTNWQLIKLLIVLETTHVALTRLNPIRLDWHRRYRFNRNSLRGIFFAIRYMTSIQRNTICAKIIIRYWHSSLDHHFLILKLIWNLGMLSKLRHNSFPMDFACTGS